MSNFPSFWRGGTSNPFRELSQLQSSLDRLFDGFGTQTAMQGFNPSCEVSEDKNGYHLKFDLPGLSKDQIRIDLHDNRLTVSGERKEEKKEDSKKRHFSEVYYGSFTRAFTFPAPVDAERVSASY